MVGGLGSSVSRNALSALDDSLLHANRAVGAMELVIKTAGIADVVAVLISPPERSGGRLAVGATEGADGSRLVILFLVVGHGDGALCAAASG